MKKISNHYVIFLVIFHIGLCISANVNIALNKDCQQSSLYHDVDWRYGPQTAVDGDTSNDMSLTATCVTTVLDQQPYWWTVNLGKTYTIDYITIYSRGDCCRERLSNYYIYTYVPSNATWNDYDADPGELFYYHDGISPLQITIASQKNIQAQYVKIVEIDPLPSLAGKALSFCEVEIYTTGMKGNTRQNQFCKSTNNKNANYMIIHNTSVSVLQCARLCQQTEGCLGFDYRADGTCSLAQSNIKAEPADPPMPFYMKC